MVRASRRINAVPNPRLTGGLAGESSVARWLQMASLKMSLYHAREEVTALAVTEARKMPVMSLCESAREGPAER
jgi:hypothetical protein